MALEDFLIRHPGWRVVQRPISPRYRAEREDCALSVTADSISALDVLAGEVDAQMAAA